MDKNSPYQISRLGEELAAKYLVSKGYTLLSKNFRTKNGEIDIIVHNDTHLVFVEVKTPIPLYRRRLANDNSSQEISHYSGSIGIH